MTSLVLRKKVVKRLVRIGGLGFWNSWVRHWRCEYCGITLAACAKSRARHGGGARRRGAAKVRFSEYTYFNELKNIVLYGTPITSSTAKKMTPKTKPRTQKSLRET